MPELPEVETVRRTLLNKIINEKIDNVLVRCNNIIAPDTPNSFSSKLIGETFRNILRIGKYLIFILDHVSIISHLRMEGKFFIKDKDEELVKHEHVIFYFKSGVTLRYHDTRKFGIMKVVLTTSIDNIMKDPTLSKLGIEGNSSSLTPEYLLSKLSHIKKPIKTTLLDQTIISGLGNIYVDEVLFLSKIHPLRISNTITYYESSNIVKYSKQVLDNAILDGGTTIRSYTSSLGVTGRFQQHLFVHTKSNQPCITCSTIIKKTKVGGRGTYYCESCQNIDKPIVYGITGSIATGKSTVSNYLRSLGYLVIDSDKIVHELLKTKIIIDKIVSVFGKDVLVNNQLDKKLLAKLIFNDDSLRNRLNSIIHKEVFNVIERRINECGLPFAFIDVPLLFEAGFDVLCNKTICVYVNKETEVTRLMNRDNIDEDFAIKKISSQMSIEDKKLKANYIIDNSGDLCYTYKQIDELLNKYIKRG